MISYRVRRCCFACSRSKSFVQTLELVALTSAVILVVAAQLLSVYLSVSMVEAAAS